MICKEAAKGPEASMSGAEKLVEFMPSVENSPIDKAGEKFLHAFHWLLPPRQPLRHVFRLTYSNALADHNQLAIVHSLIFEIISFHKDVPVLSYCITVLFHSVEKAIPSKSEEASQGPSPSIRGQRGPA
jgi:hypothetical protein